MDNHPGNGLLTDQELEYLGGYLAGQLAYLRSNISMPGAVRVNVLLDDLSLEMSKIDTTDKNARYNAIERCDETLTLIDSSLDNMLIGLQKSFLFSLHKNIEMVTSDDNIRKFLEILCNDETEDWRSTKGYFHDCRQALRDIGVRLFEIHRLLQDDLLREIPTKLEVLLKLLGVARQFLDINYFMRENRRLAGRALSAYMHSSYYTVAHDMLLNKINQIINEEQLENRKEELIENRDIVVAGFAYTSQPSITPLIDLLRESLSQEEFESIFIFDHQIAEIAQRASRINR